MTRKSRAQPELLLGLGALGAAVFTVVMVVWINMAWSNARSPETKKGPTRPTKLRLSTRSTRFGHTLEQDEWGIWLTNRRTRCAC
jgi:hypothetical protein